MASRVSEERMASVSTGHISDNKPLRGSNTTQILTTGNPKYQGGQAAQFPVLVTDTSTLKMEAIYFSETLVTIDRTTRYHNAEAQDRQWSFMLKHFLIV
jgi:hypothetical protein